MRPRPSAAASAYRPASKIGRTGSHSSGANLETESGNRTQGCRLESYPDWVGHGNVGSAKAPTETTRRSGSSGSV